MDSRVVTVETTATVVADQAGEIAALVAVVKNTGSQAVYLGGADVTTVNGYPLAAGDSIPVQLHSGDKLYGIVAATTADVAVVETFAEGGASFIPSLAIVLGFDADAGGARLVNLGDPTGAQDAATKAYTDAAEAAAKSYADTGLAAWVQFEPPVVNVELGGTGPGTFDMAPDKSSVSAGQVVFLIHNVGAIVHECLILRTTQTAAQVIAAAVAGGILDESQYDVVADSGDIPAGHWTRFDVQLDPAHYVLVCNEVGHAHSGMAADFDTTLLAGATSAAVTTR